MTILGAIKRALRIGSRINSSTSKSILYVDANNRIAEDNANLNWDDSGKNLGIGVASPTSPIHVLTGGDATNPLIAFGDGDSGFYETFDDSINFALGGVLRYSFSSTKIQGTTTGGAVYSSGATNTVPSLGPQAGDSDTGIGGNGSDSLSLIAGGVEATRITESSGVITQLIRSYLAIGDFSTNYVEFGSTGDINFVGGSGLQFGEIYYHGSGVDTVLALQDTWYQVLSFATNGLSNGSVTPDHTNDHITVGKAGKYRILFGLSARSAAANTYQFMIKTNNGTADKTNIMIHIVTSVAGQIEARSNSGFADLGANDTVELWVQRTDGGAVSKTITLEHVNMHVTQKGG